MCSVIYLHLEQKASVDSDFFFCTCVLWLHDVSLYSNTVGSTSMLSVPMQKLWVQY